MHICIYMYMYTYMGNVIKRVPSRRPYSTLAIDEVAYNCTGYCNCANNYCNYCNCCNDYLNCCHDYCIYAGTL